MANMLHGISPHTPILTVSTLELLLYEFWHYHRAIELFIFLDDLLVVQSLNLRVLHSKISYQSCYYEVKLCSRQFLENPISLTVSLLFDADRSLLLLRANLHN